MIPSSPFCDSQLYSQEEKSPSTPGREGAPGRRSGLCQLALTDPALTANGTSRFLSHLRARRTLYFLIGIFVMWPSLAELCLLGAPCAEGPLLVLARARGYAW